jgi:O-succinylbenzoic acid--CoA ligase
MPIARVGGLSIVTRCLAARRCRVARRIRRPPAAAMDRRGSSEPDVTGAHDARARTDAHPGWTCPARLRAVLLGGAAASSRLLARAAERRLPIVVTYGLTETCSQVTATRYAARFAPADEGAGMPLTGIDVRIANGHIEVKGATLMAGYWNDPARARHLVRYGRSRQSTHAVACMSKPGAPT